MFGDKDLLKFPLYVSFKLPFTMKEHFTPLMPMLVLGVKFCEGYLSWRPDTRGIPMLTVQ